MLKVALRTARGRSALACAVLGVLSRAAVSEASLVFDDLSNGQSITVTGSTPNTFMGDGYTLTPGTTDITGFDVFPYNGTGSNYSGLAINIYVWGTVNGGTTSATNPAFSNLLGEYSLTSTGTFTSGFYYSFTGATPGVTPGITLGTPLLLPSTTVGITLNFEGTTDGTNYNSANGLTSLISYGATSSPGSEVFNGYYRNAAGETNGNFTSTLRSLGVTNQSVALRVYGDVVPVPEPASFSFAAGAGLLLLRRRRAHFSRRS